MHTVRDRWWNTKDSLLLLNTAHPSCMDYSEELARRAKNSPWQCIDCKTCFICEDSGDAVRLSCLGIEIYTTCFNVALIAELTKSQETPCSDFDSVYNYNACLMALV